MADRIRAQLLSQAAGSSALGSPFTAAVCQVLAENLDRGSAFGRRILDWPTDPQPDALALRACGALNALARSGSEPALSATYPPARLDVDALRGAIAAAIARHDDFLTAYLDRPPQTNEVARSALILGGALHLAARVNLPLDVYEIGSSAALNLAFERYRYELGSGRTWGDPNAPVTIPCEWRGNAPPLDGSILVASRQGSDANPLDASVGADAERLMSYIWPDQRYRVDRTEAALRMARQERRRAERMDAAEWLEREFVKPQAHGTCRFLFHTIVYQYLPADRQARVDAALEAAAARATESAPVAHFAFETDYNPDGHNVGAPMTLRIWPGGEVMNLGRGDYHGRWAAWADV